MNVRVCRYDVCTCVCVCVCVMSRGIVACPIILFVSPVLILSDDLARSHMIRSVERNGECTHESGLAVHAWLGLVLPRPETVRYE
jgi:hypothetical protein